MSSGKTGGFTLAGPSKGQDRERKPKTIIVKVLVTPVIPAVVLSGNPDLVRFLKAGYPIKAFGYDKSILHDKRLLTSCSRNCQIRESSGKAGGFALAGPSKGPDGERKPKTIIVKVLVTPVIPAVVLSGNPDLVRFLKAGYPIKAFGYDKSILHDKRVLTSCSRNCQIRESTGKAGGLPWGN